MPKQSSYDIFKLYIYCDKFINVNMLGSGRKLKLIPVQTHKALSALISYSGT